MHRDGSWLVESADHSIVATQWLINCAGLEAQAVARRIESFPPAQIPTQYLAKGHYFALTTDSPFSRLVYPTPADGGLGIHLTLDLAGRARFGPDVEWISDLDAPRDYAVDASRAVGFADSIRRYWPAITTDALQPAYAGIRTKLSGPGQAAADFRIDGPTMHGINGVIHLFGIESPGLTASLAIAEHVHSQIQREHA
jgi:L-2-hydroxyglutarate oxidase LhgO